MTLTITAPTAMSVTIDRNALKRALAVLKEAIAGQKTTIPITQHLLIAAEDGRLTFTATNLELALTHRCGATVLADGRITLPYTLFSEFVDALPDWPVTLTELANRRTRIECGAYKAELNGLDPDDFPPIPTATAGASIGVDAAAFRTALVRVVPAAAADDTRPVLAGMLFELGGTTLTLAAADGFRLHVATLPVSTAIGDIGAIVPAKTCKVLAGLLDKVDGEVTVGVTSTAGQIAVDVGDTSLLSQLVQGTFPNFRQLIPSTFATTSTVAGEAFRQAVKAVAVFARGSNRIVRLESGGFDVLTVTARADEVGENVVRVDAAVGGERVRVAINDKYLADALAALPAGQVEMRGNSKSSPVLFRMPGDESFLVVCMPMYAQWGDEPAEAAA